MGRIRALGVLAPMTVVLIGAVPAFAESGKLVDFTLGLGSGAPATPAGLSLKIVVHTAGSPDAKSSPLRSVVISAPAGTRIDAGAMPQCTASDEELRVLGSAACPEDTLAGNGTYSAILGLGAPLDPFTGDNHVFNAPGQLVEVITVPGSTVSPGFDRLTVEGHTLTAKPPVTPGGPPDGETATRSIEFTLPARSGPQRSLVTTPPVCPASGRWESSGTFGFADGRRETVVSRTPCTAPVTRRCVGAGHITLAVPRSGRAATRRVALYVNGRRERTLRRSARRARVVLGGRAAGRYVLTVRAWTTDGRTLTRRWVVRTCG